MIKKILYSMIISSTIIHASPTQEEKEIKTFLETFATGEKLIAHTTHKIFNDEAYHVRTNNSEFIVSKDFKTFFPVKNSLFKKDDKNNWKPYFIPQDLTPHIKDSLFSIGQGEKEIFAFISPNCNYCNNLFKKLNETPSILNQYKIHFFFFIKEDEKAKTLANIMLESKEISKTYLDISINKYDPQFSFIRLSKEKREQNDKLIEKQYNLAKKLGATGTPALFHKNAEPFYFQKEEFENVKKQ